MSFQSSKSSGNHKSFRIDDLLQRKKASHNPTPKYSEASKVPLESEDLLIKSIPPPKPALSKRTTLQTSDLSSSPSPGVNNNGDPNNHYYSSFSRSSRKSVIASSNNNDNHNHNQTDQESSHTTEDEESSSDSNKTFSRSPSNTFPLDKPISKTPINSSSCSDRDNKSANKLPIPNFPHEYSPNPFLPPVPPHPSHQSSSSSSQQAFDLYKFYPSALLGALANSNVPSLHNNNHNSFLSSWNNSGLELGPYPLGIYNSSPASNNNSYPPNIFSHPGQLWTSASNATNNNNNSNAPAIASAFHHHHHHLDPRSILDSRAFHHHPATSHLASPFGIPYMTKLNPLLNIGNKRKGGQIRFSNSQTTQLEKAFRDHKYLNANDRKTLAHSLGLSDKQVKTWFQNRRAKYRKSKDDHFYEKEDDEEKLNDNQEPDRVLSPSYSPGDVPTYHLHHNHLHHNNNYHQSRGPSN